MAPEDDDRDVSDAQYDELRRYVPAHARSRTPRPPREDARISVLEWLSDIGSAVLRRLRRA